MEYSNEELFVKAKTSYHKAKLGITTSYTEWREYKSIMFERGLFNLVWDIITK
ncbi:hypothetical protein [Paenibacillus cremeus]|uniref:hypothetical protein n=1 Tax=Paenibacillus cremeus TaxID=2163881 RepID=UPI001646BA71|nr:hypothetical protein [Paenibacillus cremeus]